MFFFQRFNLLCFNVRKNLVSQVIEQIEQYDEIEVPMPKEITQQGNDGIRNELEIL